jgi:molybdopterin biosynthesis enzyme MoaB
MTLRQVYTVENNQLVITLPDSFKGKRTLTVTVEDSIDTNLEKLNLLAQAANDPLFISDVKEIAEDFKTSDTE